MRNLEGKLSISALTRPLKAEAARMGSLQIQ